jgi:hypothetical protein
MSEKFQLKSQLYANLVGIPLNCKYMRSEFGYKTLNEIGGYNE